jgi:DNA-binding CsgD family transcriptional regulator/tetratricopeptide (TPR) repeat protein
MVSLSPTIVVGRDGELALARRVIAGLSQGRGTTLLIEGEAGIGKTRFVQWMTDEVRSLGVTVLRGVGHPFERTRPFGGLADALDLRRRSSDPRRATIAHLLAGDVERSAPDGVAHQDLRYRVVEEIFDLVEEACGESPVMLVVEDLHWVDGSTLLALRSLVQRLAYAPLLLVGTVRPAPRSADLDQFLGDALRSGAHHVSLHPLRAPDVDAIAQSELGLPPAPELSAVLAKAAGNPLWVVEMIRSLSAERRLRSRDGAVEPTSTELPDSLRELVVRRLRYLPETTIELLQITAVLGDAVSIDDVGAVARRPATEVVAGLREAFQARLLGEQDEAVVFRHQLVHDAVYQSMPRPVRRALHRDAAGSLARSGAELLRVADHLVLGAGRGDLEAIRWLRAAARDTGASSPDVAVELLRRAESLLPAGHPDADLIAAEMVDALLRAGNVGEAAARAEAVLDRAHRADADTRLRLALISALSLQNRPAELIERTESVLTEAEDLPPAARSLVLAQASYGRTFSGDLLGGEGTARRALEEAERSGDVATVVWSLTTMSVAVKSQGRYADALELTRRAVTLAFDPPYPDARLRHPLFFHGLVLSDSDRPAEARVAFDRALDECDVLQSAWLLPDTILMSAEARLLAGAWDDANAELEAGLTMADERGQRILVGQSLAYQAIIAGARGDHEAAHAALKDVEVRLDASAPPYGSELVAFALALSNEAEGDQIKAFERLVSLWDHDARRSNRYYHRYLAPALVRLALELDDRRTAERVSELTTADAALAPEVPSVQSAALRCQGLLRADAACLMEAVPLARRSGRVIDHASACEDAGRVLAGAGRTSEARELLVEATALYESLDARSWMARTEAGLRRLGVRRGTRGPRRRPAYGWESLTATEQKVVALATEREVSKLVAQGLTNREVARRLHVSPHTVNTHLRHLFQKLTVSNRAELAATVTRSTPSPS